MSTCELEHTSSQEKDPSPSSLPKVSRREFARNAAAIAAGSFSPASGLLASSFDPAGQHAEDKPQEAANLGLTAEQVREADARLANAIRDFGQRLSDEQRQHLRRILLYNQRMLVSIRAFHVENGDPPASVLNFDDRNGC